MEISHLHLLYWVSLFLSNFGQIWYGCYNMNLTNNLNLSSTKMEATYNSSLANTPLRGRTFEFMCFVIEGIVTYLYFCFLWKLASLTFVLLIIVRPIDHITYYLEVKSSSTKDVKRHRHVLNNQTKLYETF